MIRKELFRFKINEGSDCFYCGEAGYIDHSFISCQFTISFTQEVLQWFNATYGGNFIWSPTCNQCNEGKPKLHSAVSVLLHLQKKTPE